MTQVERSQKKLIPVDLYKAAMGWNFLRLEVDEMLENVPDAEFIEVTVRSYEAEIGNT